MISYLIYIVCDAINWVKIFQLGEVVALSALFNLSSYSYDILKTIFLTNINVC